MARRSIRTDMGAAALPVVTDDDWPQEIADLRDGFAGRLNVYRVMAHHPALLRAWVDLREHVVRGNALGTARSEIVILRASQCLGSEYEWAHHVSRARACGIDETRIASIRYAPADMEPEDAVLARAVDDLTAGARLQPGTARDLSDLVGAAGVLDLIATVGFYSTLAFILNTFDPPLDDRIVRELRDRPLSP